MTSLATPAAIHRLSELTPGQEAIVVRVEFASNSDPIAERLEDLGFVQGEPLRMIAHGPLGADPLVVQVGYTRFALRRAEANRILITDTVTTP